MKLVNNLILLQGDDEIFFEDLQDAHSRSRRERNKKNKSSRKSHSFKSKKKTGKMLKELHVRIQINVFKF